MSRARPPAPENRPIAIAAGFVLVILALGTAYTAVDARAPRRCSRPTTCCSSCRPAPSSASSPPA